MTRLVDLFCNGYCPSNPGFGAWATILQCEFNGKTYTKEFHGNSDGRTTNNRMTLTALIEGLGKLKFDGCFVTVYTDSRYIVDAIAKGWVHQWSRNQWKKKDGKVVANADLWSVFIKEYHRHHLIKCVYIGHLKQDFEFKASDKCKQISKESLERLFAEF
jgi:ribonuclease HI